MKAQLLFIKKHPCKSQNLEHKRTRTKSDVDRVLLIFVLLRAKFWYVNCQHPQAYILSRLQARASGQCIKKFSRSSIPLCYGSLVQITCNVLESSQKILTNAWLKNGSQPKCLEVFREFSAIMTYFFHVPISHSIIKRKARSVPLHFHYRLGVPPQQNS